MKTAVHLQRDVLDELNWEPGVDAAHIGVTVNDGVLSSRVRLANRVVTQQPLVPADKSDTGIYPGGESRDVGKDKP